MIWHFLRYILSLTIPAFYRKIQVLHPERIPADKPAVLSFNHPNAFTDPLGITFGIWPVRTWYMARGDVFKPGLISRILENIGIVPVFRMQDAGKEGLEKNEESYRRVYYLLRRKKKVIVFSEGLCVQERRLRPVKKGVPRMLMTAWEEVKNPALSVIPVGLFYSRPDRFGSDWLFLIGEPVPLKNWYEKYREEPARTLFLLRQHIEDEMKKLVIHIENPSFDEAAEYLEILYLNEFLCKNSLENIPENRYLLAKRITNHLNNLNSEEQEKMKELSCKINEIFELCRKNKIRPWMCDEYFFKRWGKKIYLYALLLFILTPVYLFAYMLLVVPNALSIHLTKKIVKSREFYSSFLIGIGSFMLLFWFMGISGLFSFYFRDVRYPVFVPVFYLLILLAGFWYKQHISYIKLFSYLYRRNIPALGEVKEKILSVRKEWETLTNFKVS